MAPTHVPLSIVHEIRDQIMAKIRPVIDDAISEAVTSAVESIPIPSLGVPWAARPDVSKAYWIWTHEEPRESPPVGPRAFRKVEFIPSGYTVNSMVIDIGCASCHALYVNGQVVSNYRGHGILRYSIVFPPMNRVIIAVCASRNPTGSQQPGMIASAVMWNSANYKGRTFTSVTDGDWVTSTTAAFKGFERLDYNQDDSWYYCRVPGAFGDQPWSGSDWKKPTVTSGLKTEYQSGTFFNPPSASTATPGPPAEAVQYV